MGKKRIGNFRSNIFGGFNRRDVIGYIEQLHKKLDDLQEENELLRVKLPSEELEDKDDLEPQNNLLEPELEEGSLEMEPEADEPKAEPDDSELSSSFEHIEDVLPEDNAQSSGQSVTVTKETVKVRKKTKR